MKKVALLSMNIIALRSGTNLFRILNVNFPILFEAQPVFMIFLKFCLFMFFNVLFLLSVLSLLTKLLRFESLASFVVIFVYFIPFVLPLFKFQRFNFYALNPFTYFDAEMYLSGVRDYYWNKSSSDLHITQNLGLCYIAISSIIFNLFNILLVNIGRKRR